MPAVVTEREIRILEFDRIREQLADLTVTSMGRELALAILPEQDYEQVERRLKETSEARVLCAALSFSPPPADDIEPPVSRACKGGTLSGPELAKIAVFLQGVRRWHRFFNEKSHRELLPLMAGLAAGLDECTALARRLSGAIEPDGSVSDSASPLLAALRREKRHLQEKIREKMESYLRSPGYRNYLQEQIITIRNGRYVLPVKLEYRHRLEGVVHDQSGSGATLYLEPLPVVELQNQLTATCAREEREIERILWELSVLVQEQAGQLLNNRDIYGNLDLVAARGLLSLRQAAVEPVLLAEGSTCLYLEEARHPLLPGHVVPLTVTLGEEHRVLVITGPNTGGKTVALKTIGLTVMMAQCGLHIPAGPDSRLSIFDRIRADIGDEQSIQQSLSTFSGHLKNIIGILQETGPQSLVLLDELGAGTDPSEGAALAMAILDELKRCGTLTVATTHINDLKIFAQGEAAMQNAAMEFDRDTMSPTYRLLQGVPGQSNALAIAERLGLPAPVMERARLLLHSGHQKIEEVIEGLVEDRRRYSRESSLAAMNRAQAESLRQSLEEEREKLLRQKEEILREARTEARLLIRRARRTADELIRQLQELKDSGGLECRRRAEEIRRELQVLQEETVYREEPDQRFAGTLSPAELTAGSPVLVRSLNREGEIVAVSGQEALVRVGPLKVTVSLGDLRPVRARHGGGENGKTAAVAYTYTLQKSSTARPEIDVRGKTVEEAVPLVEKAIDDALCAGLSQVTIIHGQGTGRLKEGLRSYLKENPQVCRIRSGGAGEGGDGVTVALLSG